MIVPELLPDTVIIIAIFWFQYTIVRFGHHNSGLSVEETQREVVDWIRLPQNRERCRAVVNQTSSTV